MTARNGSTLKIYRDYDVFGMQDASVRAAKDQDLIQMSQTAWRKLTDKYKQECDQIKQYIKLNNGEIIVDNTAFVKPPPPKKRKMQIDDDSSKAPPPPIDDGLPDTNRSNLRRATTDKGVIEAIDKIRQKKAPLWAYEKGSHRDSLIQYNMDIVAKMKAQRTMIIPDCAWKETWDWFVIMWVFYNAFYIPVDLAYAPDQTNMHILVDLVCDTCFAIDMILSFRTGFYVTKRGATQVLVMGPIKVRRYYLKTWFWIDFAATFPFELVCYLLGIDVSLSVLGLLKMPRLLRLGRLLKKLQKSKNALFVALFTLIFFFVLAAHIVACIYYLIGKLQEGGPNDEQMWINHYKVSESVMTAYFTTMFWSLTSFLKTPSLAPRTTFEFLFVGLEQIISIIVVAYIMGKVTAILNEAGMAQKQFRDRIKNVNKLADFNRLDPDIKSDMVTFVEHSMISSVRSTENDPTLKQLPVYVKESITQFQLRDVIENCKMWDALRGAENTIFKNSLHVTLTYQPVLKNSTVVQLSEHCADIFILPEQGNLKVTDHRRAEGAELGNHLCTLRIFCVFGLLNEPENQPSANQDYPPVRDVRIDSLEECDLLRLSKADIETFTTKFPNEMKVLCANVRRSCHPIKISHDSFDPVTQEKPGQLRRRTSVMGIGDFQTPEDPKWVIPPESTYKEIWDWYIIILVFYNSFYIPFELAYVNSDPNAERSVAIQFFDYFVDICFVVDIVLSFRSGYIDASNFKPVRVMDKHKIYWKYLKGWFLIDFPATFPFDLLFIVLGVEVQLSFLGLMKMPRLLRISKLMKKLQKFKNADLVQLIQIFFTLVFIMHLVGCALFLVGMDEGNQMDPEGTYWIKFYRIPNNVLDMYMASTYAALASLLKMPVVRPQTTLETSVFCILLLFGIFVLAGCVGKIVGVLTAFSAKKANEQARMKAANTFIFDNNISPKLGDRIREYTEYQMNLMNKRVQKNEEGKKFPLALKMKIANAQFSELFKRNPAMQRFDGAARDPRQLFRNTMGVDLQFKVCLHNDFIMFRYAASKDLWFVPDKGCLELMGETDFDVEHQFTDWSCIGWSKFACEPCASDGYYSIRNRGDSDLVLLDATALNMLHQLPGGFMTEFQDFVVSRLKAKAYDELTVQGIQQNMEMLR